MIQPSTVADCEISTAMIQRLADKFDQTTGDPIALTSFGVPQ